jgi:hypothetical protein
MRRFAEYHSTPSEVKFSTIPSKGTMPCEGTGYILSNSLRFMFFSLIPYSIGMLKSPLAAGERGKERTTFGPAAAGSYMYLFKQY